ncbi:MAG: hypothetical protein HJJLKODD_00984 [Phycisphaerae bacterium]|nr:hypothetical protein [Phycisphaerae bacterium]
MRLWPTSTTTWNEYDEDFQELLDNLAHYLIQKLRDHHQPTYEHSLRVHDLVLQMAAVLNIPPEQRWGLARAALLHDLGKVGVPVPLLEKCDPLTGEEWDAIDAHCEIGAELLRKHRLLRDEAHVVLHHHRWYSANYPLRHDYNSKLDFYTDVVAVADAYDALTAGRPYRASTSIQRTLAVLQQRSGTQFNPRALQALQQVVCPEKLFLPHQALRAET